MSNIISKFNIDPNTFKGTNFLDNETGEISLKKGYEIEIDLETGEISLKKGYEIENDLANCNFTWEKIDWKENQEMNVVKIMKVKNGAILPQQGKPGSAGYDLFAKIDQPIELKPGQFQLIPTGIAIQLPRGYEAQIRPRSGLAINHGITVLNSPGTIDYGYLDEIKVLLINFGKEPFTITPNMRIAQLVVSELTEFEFDYVNEFDEGFNRGGGFGSSGY